MATVPASASIVRLLRGIPFSNDYKHTRYFNTRELQLNYFMGKPVVHSMTQSNIIRAEGKTSFKVDKGIDDLRRSNYIMFQNTGYNERWFYGFVTKLEYINERVTMVYFDLDVYQTWCKDFEIKPSYVVREHCKLWNSDGSPVLNTQDEFLDYGKEYDTMGTYNHRLNRGLKWLVIVSKTLLHGVDEKKHVANRVGVIQPLSYYIVPFREDQGELDEISVRIGIGATKKKVTDIDYVLTSLYSSDSTVNNIVSLYITENIGIDVQVAGSGFPDDITIPNNVKASLETISKGTDAVDPTIIYIEEVKEFTAKLEYVLADKYSGFRKSKESKLMLHPYCLTTIDDFKGNRIDVKNEYIKGNALNLLCQGSLGTSNKVSYAVSGYNNKDNETIDKDRLISIEEAIIDVNPNDVPILTEHLASYLQGNRNSIQNSKDTAIVNGASTMLRSGIQVGMGITPRSQALAGVDAVKGMADTVLQLQGIQAKQDDIANIPPQITKMGSNIAFDIGNRYSGVHIIKKQIKPEYMKKLEDFFNMFGYKLNEVKVPNITTRRYWNYVQTTGVNIYGEFNSEDLNEIKAIYNNGITFWHTDDIGNYNLANEVL